MTRRIMLTADAVGGVWRQCLELAAGLTARGGPVLLAVMGPHPSREQFEEVSALSGCEVAVTDLPLDWTADSPEMLRHASMRLAGLAGAWRADSIQLHAPALAGMGGAAGGQARAGGVRGVRVDSRFRGNDEGGARDDGGTPGEGGTPGGGGSPGGGGTAGEGGLRDDGGLLSVRSWPAPVVAMAHSCVGTWWRAVRGGDLPPDLAWRAEMTRCGLLNADVVAAPSQSFADELVAFYRLKRPVHVIPNGAQPIGMPRTPMPHALTAGRLWDAGKNIATLDEAAALCGVPVRAAGSVHGPNGASIVARHLRLLGNLGPAALACEYAHAAVFVSVARYEPFGLAVLEAAQAGCALLLSDIPTYRELWSGAAGFVDPSDPAAVAAMLRDMIADPASCARRGELARRRALCFTADAMAAATWALHRDLVAAPAMAAE
ncbi:MAG TPA: glycosyltransferase [Acetobacteraceae bacterium]